MSPAMAGARNSRLQFVAAEARQRRRGHVGLHADGHRHAAAFDVAQRLGHGHRVGIVEPGAAVLLGLGQAQQAQLAQPLEHLVRGEDLRGLPFVDVRIDLLVDEALERLLDLEVFVGVVALFVSCIRHPADPRSTGANMDAGQARRFVSHPRHSELHGPQLPSCACAQMSRHNASTARVSRGSITPSSSSRPGGVERIGLRFEHRDDLVELGLATARDPARCLCAPAPPR